MDPHHHGTCTRMHRDVPGPADVLCSAWARRTDPTQKTKHPPIAKMQIFGISFYIYLFTEVYFIACLLDQEPNLPTT